MIPAAFEYHAPKSIEDALRLLDRHGDEAKLLAGGHSLLPAMKLRLASPALLVDLSRVTGLSYIKENAGTVQVGAMTTHADVAASTLLAKSSPLLCQAAREFGAKEILVAGGVSANKALREAFTSQSEFKVHIPKLSLCTDNAAMVASAGYFRYALGHRSEWNIDVLPTWPLP